MARMVSSRSRRRDDRGAVSLELVVVASALLLLVGLFLFGYRLWNARAAVLSAAEAGARSATLTTSAGAGSNAARASVEENLRLLGVRCGSAATDVDAAALSLPAGTPGSVTVRVTCRVGMGDLLLPGAPGSVTVTRTASEVVNRFTEHRP